MPARLLLALPADQSAPEGDDILHLPAEDASRLVPPEHDGIPVEQHLEIRPRAHAHRLLELHGQDQSAETVDGADDAGQEITLPGTAFLEITGISSRPDECTAPKLKLPFVDGQSASVNWASRRNAGCTGSHHESASGRAPPDILGRRHA